MTDTISFARRLLTVAAFVAAAAAVVPAAAQSADGNDRRILIENRAGQAIVYVRGTPTSDDSFGADRIPDRIIASGQGSVVDFDSGTSDCLYDLRATMADGRHVDRMNVNVCRVAHWTIGERTNSLR